MSLQDIYQRLHEPALSLTENHATLEQLRTLLSQEDEKGLVRAQAIDAQVDRLLCWRISCAIPQLASTTVAGGTCTAPVLPDRTGLQLTLTCLSLLWTKPSTTERRREARRQGVDLCNGLLLLWQTFANDPELIQPIRLIIKSWTKLLKEDQVIQNVLFQQSNLVSFLTRQLEWKHKQSTSISIMACDPPSGYLSIMKHLVFRANGPQKEHLYEQWREQVLYYSRATRGFGSRGMNDEQVAECADYTSAILWNWTVWGPLARRMETSPEIWEVFQSLLRYGHDTKHLSVQRHALSAIGTVVSYFSGATHGHSEPWDPENMGENVPQMLQEQGWILGDLIDLMQVTRDGDSRRRCLRTIRCFSATCWGRLYLQRAHSTTLANKPFLSLLLQILRSPEDKEEDASVHIQVCQTIASLAPCFSQEWIRPWSSPLQAALVQKVQHSKDNKALVVAALLALGACLDQEGVHMDERSFSSTFFHQLVHLTKECQDQDSEFHQVVADFLHRSVLVHHSRSRPGSRKRAAADAMDEEDHVDRIEEPTWLCSFTLGPILGLFCALLSSTGLDFESSRSQTVESLSLLLLSSNNENNNALTKKAMADHEELLSALVNLCLLPSTGESTKKQSKQIILMLVPEL